MTGWNIAFAERGKYWMLTFVTHPNCVGLDSAMFGAMLESFTV